MSRSFSYAMRRQCAVLDLLDMILSRAGDLFDGPMPSKTRAVIGRIRTRRMNIMRLVFHLGNGELVDLGPQRERQYIRVKKGMLDAIQLFWPGSDRHQPVDGTSMMNAIMALVEDTRAQVPEGRKARKEWDSLTGSLFTLYCHIDPGVDDQAGMKTGLSVAGAMEDAIAGRQIRMPPWMDYSRARIVKEVAA